MTRVSTDLLEPFAGVDLGQVSTPALLFSQPAIEANLDRMSAIAGSPERLRPHFKTHKTAEIARLWVERGALKHKCATIAEAETLARAGATDVLLAYQPVGPAAERVAALAEAFPAVRWTVLLDDAAAAAALSRHATGRGVKIECLVDLDVGQHRTGVPAGKPALALAATLAESPGLRLRGLQAYDGHVRETDLDARRATVAALWAPVAELRTRWEQTLGPVETIVCGGTGTFPLYAEMAAGDAAIEASPGTCVLHDSGYLRIFPDLPFRPAAVVASRVVSRPTPERVTLDAGCKALASDPPLALRALAPQAPGAQIVAHNEEHLVLETGDAKDFAVGDLLFLIPGHVCPTVSLYDEALVVDPAGATWTWRIVARSRRLSV